MTHWLSLVSLRHEFSVLKSGLIVIFVLIGPLGQLHFLSRHFFVRDQAQKMRNAVQASPFLVIRRTMFERFFRSGASLCAQMLSDGSPDFSDGEDFHSGVEFARCLRHAVNYAGVLVLSNGVPPFAAQV